MSKESRFRVTSTEALISNIGVTSAMVRMMFRMYTGRDIPQEEWEKLSTNVDETLNIAKELLAILQEQADGD